MQIAICDDEKSIGLILEEKMKKLLPDAVIDKYLSGDELIANCVTMENGTALIAKQNYSEFVKQYLKYNQRKGKEIG